jgi:hypothetical protein
VASIGLGPIRLKRVRADERLQSFIEELEPRLRAFLPAATARNLVAHQAEGRQSQV